MIQSASYRTRAMLNSEHEDVESPRVELRVSNSACGRRIREFVLINKGYKHIEEFLLSAFELYKQKIVETVTEFDLIKCSF